jgi:hypothetical protein
MGPQAEKCDMLLCLNSTVLPVIAPAAEDTYPAGIQHGHLLQLFLCWLWQMLPHP